MAGISTISRSSLGDARGRTVLMSSIRRVAAAQARPCRPQGAGCGGAADGDDTSGPGPAWKGSLMGEKRTTPAPEREARRVRRDARRWRSLVPVAAGVVAGALALAGCGPGASAGSGPAASVSGPGAARLPGGNPNLD